MAELPTVEIYSPKDHSQKWIINAADFDPNQHVMWGDTNRLPDPRYDIGTEPVEEPDAMPVEPAQPHTGMRPSVPDYVHDDDGNIVAVNIIDPERRTSRKEIPYGDFDPDTHQLWSEHPRFN